MKFANSQNTLLGRWRFLCTVFPVHPVSGPGGARALNWGYPASGWDRFHPAKKKSVKTADAGQK
jgi:hypothetical protein